MIDIQLNMLAVSVMMGAFMGITYDALRIIRRIISHNNFFISLEDLIYWLIWTVVCIDNVHEYNEGELRIYIFVGIVVGLVVYIYTIGWALWKVISHILCFAKKTIKN
ncbi:MAG: hypothetical protein E7258_01925 [Lachnospiraceae bacterium]|nr:hypothetical protein [Lachnospiraceae bacterium]